jgi:hypothetical protein
MLAGARRTGAEFSRSDSRAKVRLLHLSTVTILHLFVRTCNNPSPASSLRDSVPRKVTSGADDDSSRQLSNPLDCGKGRGDPLVRCLSSFRNLRWRLGTEAF